MRAMERALWCEFFAIYCHGRHEYCSDGVNWLWHTRAQVSVAMGRWEWGEGGSSSDWSSIKEQRLLTPRSAG